MQDYNFMKVCLETSKYIMQRKKIYKKDIDFIMVSLFLCNKFIENKDIENNEDFRKLRNQFFLILDRAYCKFGC